MEGTWRKSSYSQGADNCVELTWDKQGLLTRDSKGDLSVMLVGCRGCGSESD